MGTHSKTSAVVDYPTRDGRPMGETEVHRDNMIGLIQALQNHFADDPRVCVSGNLMMYYVRGDKRQHVSPDVFVVRDIPKRPRIYYLVWEEGKGPDLVIELTSPSTRHEDLDKKFTLYRDTLRVGEYFLFDPFEQYLEPSLQGYRLVEGQYLPIELEAGRLPSAVLGLHLERLGTELRLYDPQTGRLLPTAREIAAQLRQTEEEMERLRRELEALRRRLPS
jgi:Uma2 family endonuclease